MKNPTWQNSEQLFVAQALIKKLTHSAAEIRTNMKHLLLILMSIIGLGSVSILMRLQVLRFRQKARLSHRKNSTSWKLKELNLVV